MIRENEEKISKITENVAGKLLDYKNIEKIQNQKDNQKIILGDSVKWDRTALCSGLPGVCLLLGEMIEKNPKENVWQEIANEYIGYVVDDISQNGFDSISLHNGLSGVGLGVTAIAKRTGGYNKLITNINKAIVSNIQIPIKLTQQKAIIGYDVIAGLTGILSYLMLYMEDNAVYDAIVEGVQVLIDFTKDWEKDGIKTYGWLVPPEALFTDEERKTYPEGAFNTGYAHGIAGVLAILSKMIMSGLCLDGQKEAINRIMDYYDRYKIFEDNRYIWKGEMGFDEHKAVQNKEPFSGEEFFRRDAWCYGAPGISYAMVLAGRVMEDETLVDWAGENLKKAIEKKDAIYSMSMCHGHAGILQLAKSASVFMKEGYLDENINNLEQCIINSYDVNNPFGFVDKDYDQSENIIKEYNEIGILNGSSGIVLALQDNGQENRVWKRAFAL